MRDDGQPAPQTIWGLWQALALSAFVVVLLWDLTVWLDLSLTDDAVYSGRGARLAAGGWGELSLVGRPAMVQVVHNTSVYDGQEKTFANVQNVLPAIGDPLLPDGHYVRVHDRTRE